MPNPLKALSSTLSHAKLLLVKPPAINNRVVINYWQPGCKIIQQIESHDGLTIEEKVFKPMPTFAAVLAHIKGTYGRIGYLKYKDDAYPGHVSLQTASHYLSIGSVDVLEQKLEGDKFSPLKYVGLFDLDCAALNRIPERRIALHSLDIDQIDRAIEGFLSAKKIYSLLEPMIRLK